MLGRQCSVDIVDTDVYFTFGRPVVKNFNVSRLLKVYFGDGRFAHSLTFLVTNKAQNLSKYSTFQTKKKTLLNDTYKLSQLTTPTKITGYCVSEKRASEPLKIIILRELTLTRKEKKSTIQSRKSGGVFAQLTNTKSSAKDLGFKGRPKRHRQEKKIRAIAMGLTILYLVLKIHQNPANKLAYTLKSPIGTKMTTDSNTI